MERAMKERSDSRPAIHSSGTTGSIIQNESPKSVIEPLQSALAESLAAAPLALCLPNQVLTMNFVQRELCAESAEKTPQVEPMPVQQAFQEWSSFYYHRPSAPWPAIHRSPPSLPTTNRSLPSWPATHSAFPSWPATHHSFPSWLIKLRSSTLLSSPAFLAMRRFLR
jgi:hypothetical protein